MTLFASVEGNTPLSPEEQGDLIPNLATKEELNEWERQNILEARSWALSEKNLKNANPFFEPYIRQVHLRMFDQTWKWAGVYRKTEKNIGVPFHQIQEKLGILLGDAIFWRENHTYSVDEMTIRFHHRLVQIHPFPNGNGRHGRMMADIVAQKHGNQPFTWGTADIIGPGKARHAYIEALQAADGGDLSLLSKFARS